eukprot:gene7145-14545_t
MIEGSKPKTPLKSPIRSQKSERRTLRMVDANEKDSAESKFRQTIVKLAYQRSYDDLVIIKTYISRMDFMRHAFSELHPKQVDELCKYITIESFPSNSIIFQQGDRGDKFYVLLTGEVQITVNKDIKEEEITSLTDEERATLTPPNATQDTYKYTKNLIKLGSGQFFGERALNSNDARTATVTTLNFTDTLVVKRDTYRRIL